MWKPIYLLKDGQADIGDMAMQISGSGYSVWPRHADAEFDAYGDGDADDEAQPASPLRFWPNCAINRMRVEISRKLYHFPAQRRGCVGIIDVNPVSVGA